MSALRQRRLSRRLAYPPPRCTPAKSSPRSPQCWSSPSSSGAGGGSSLERKGIGILIALALGVYASGVLSELPDPKKVIEDIAEALGPWTYALVGVMAFLETGAFVGLVAPGETVVIAGGVIAGQGEI